MRARRPSLPWLLFALGLALGLGLSMFNFLVVERMQGGAEMRLVWKGLRVWWLAQSDPYLQSQTQPLVSGFEGVMASALRRFDLPFPFLLLISPLVFLPTSGWSAAVGLLVLELALPLTLFFTWRLLEWPAGRWARVALFLFAWLWPYSLFGLFSVTPFWLFLALFHLGWTAYNEDQDELAGALWALLTLRWEATAPLLLFLTLYLLRRRRWRVLAGAGMLLFLLYAVSFLIWPGWFLPFLRAVAFNLRQGFGLNLLQVFLAYFPRTPFPVSPLVSLALWLLLAVEWRALTADERPLGFYWLLSLTLSATPLLGWRVDTPALTLLFPALMLILVLVWRRWPRYRLFLPPLLALLVLLVPWALWAQAQRYPQQPFWQEAFLLFPPLFSLIGLYWLRWSLFRPRTWMDEIKGR